MIIIFCTCLSLHSYLIYIATILLLDILRCRSSFLRLLSHLPTSFSYIRLALALLAVSILVYIATFPVSQHKSSTSNQPAEMDLRQWFEEYKALDANDLFLTSSPIKAVEADELDPDFVEQRIQESTPKSIVGKGFCIKCQELFNNWPTLGDSSNRQHDSKPDPVEKGWEKTVARSISTFELEASTRAGCRFCAFMLQNLKDCKLLETSRKVEARLYQLGEDSTLSLSIQNWGTNPIQILWLNLPGKVCTSCNSGIALAGNSNSAFLPTSGV